MATDRSAFSPKRVFRELRWEISKVLFLKELLNATILFFALNILLTVFNMSYIPSAIVAVLFLIVRLARGFRKALLRKIEEGNPEVHEILRTAYEYQGEQSIMAQGLLYDLQRKLATVSTGVLLDPKKIMARVGMIMALAFVPVLIISFTPFLLQQNPFAGVDMMDFFGEQRAEAFRDVFGIELNESAPNYGDAQVLDLGDDEYSLEVRSGGSTVAFNEIHDPESRSFRYNEFPSDITPEAAESSASGSYTEEEIALINDYTCRTKGICS